MCLDHFRLEIDEYKMQMVSVLMVMDTEVKNRKYMIPEYSDGCFQYCF